MKKAQNEAVARPVPGITSTKLVIKMAAAQDLDPDVYASTVMKSCFSGETTPEQFTAFLMIAREHGLNPITREIYAFASRGKVMPIVSIDGWLKIINEHSQFDGMQFVDDVDDEGGLIAVTCKIYRKDRKHPTEVTEYLQECQMPTEPWKKWPARMLRHKATIQAARYAFGFSGIMDSDEAQRIDRMDDIEGHAHTVEEAPTTPAARIVHKVQSKVEKEVIVPPEGEEEVSVGDIPGLKKASVIEQPEIKGNKPFPMGGNAPYIDPETGEVVPDDVGYDKV